jgi:hypothetical protein
MPTVRRRRQFERPVYFVKNSNNHAVDAHISEIGTT